MSNKVVLVTGNFNVLHEDLGNSWRLSEFASAFGLIQLENLERMVIQRDKQVEALAKQIGMIHDQKNRDIKSGNFKRAMESMNRQADEHNLQDMQNRIERIEFDRMSDGSGGF